MNTTKLSWQPDPGASKKILAAFAVGGGMIGVVGFSVSFWSVAKAAWPFLGWASWTLPVLVDLGIFTLSGLSLFLELHEIRSRWIRMIPNALAAFTVYLNVATQPSLFGRAVHAAGPLLWVTVVEIATFTVRRLVGLSSESAMDRVRGSRWLLAPFSTARLRRRMILDEQPSYKAAIGREQDRTVSRALLRQWYGRAWRSKAPRPEKLAVKLQGLTSEPVAELLTRASAGITAAAEAALRPVPDTAQETGEGAPEPVSGSTRRPLDPIVYPVGERPVLPSFAPFTTQRFPFTPTLKTLPTEDGYDAPENDGVDDPVNEVDRRAEALRLHREGLSFQQIGDRLNRSKTWAHRVVTAALVEHANGHTAA